MTEQPTEYQKGFGDENSELYIEPVFGFRVWRVIDVPQVTTEKSLRGLPRPRLVGNWGGIWSVGENVAYCKQPGGVSYMQIEKDCSCGYYGYWTANQFQALTAAEKLASTSRKYVAGVIKAYGIVFIGKHGFRASKSEIVALAPMKQPIFAFLSRTAAELDDIPQEFRAAVPCYDDDGIKRLSGISNMLTEFPCAKPVF